MRRQAWIWLLCVGLMAGYGVWRVGRGQALQTDLLAMLPDTERNPVAEAAIRSLARTTGDRAMFLVRAGDDRRGMAAALRLAGSLARSGAFLEVQSTLPQVDPGAVARFYTGYRYRLPGASLARGPALEALVQGRLASPQGGLSGTAPALDPLGQLDGFLAGLPFSALRLELRDNLLVIPSPEGLNILISAGLPGSAYDPAVQRRVLAAVRDARAELRGAFPEARVLRTGVVFYAADARQSAEREANLFSTLSMLCIFALYFGVFRSGRHLVLGLACVAAGLATAAAGCLLIFGKLYLLTLVCGSCVLGVAVDYSFLYFAHQVGAGAAWQALPGLRRILPALLVGLATTLLGYSALLAAPFPGLRQIAVFSILGLAGAFLTVLLVLPDWLRQPGPPRPALLARLRRLLDWGAGLASRRRLPLWMGLLALLLAWGACRARVDDDVQGLIRPSQELLGQENAIRQLTGLSNNAAFFLVEGPSEGAVLSGEEALRLRLAGLGAADGLTGIQAVSCFVPSPAAQEAALERHRAQMPDLARALDQVGFRPEAVARLRADLADAQDRPLTVAAFFQTPFSTPFRMLWLGATAHGYGSVVFPMGDPDSARLAQAAAGIPGVVLVDKARSVTGLLGHYRRIASWALSAAILLVWLVLALWRGFRASTAMVAPPCLGMLAALAGCALAGAPVTLFTVMALILLLGFGVDYTVFLAEGGRTDPSALLGVLLAAGATLISYGLLAFSHTPALGGFGLTLALGVAGTILLSWMALRPGSRS
jgi:predicted exporter